ncbi:SE-domain-containing protein [Infundibulicybe gibba]|nr:SE-domain-containing protein [Infundibulicybe gibba]
MSNHYDVVIVGAGIAGSAMAHALSTLPPEPDRIVGELLQPGGVAALKQLGLRACLDGIDAITVKGYCVVETAIRFHHGRFVMTLREAARRAGADMIEATVSDLIECEKTGKVKGVQATRKAADSDAEQAKESYFADLVIIADGCFSNFRSSVMGKSACKSTTKSHFIGAILEDATLPIPEHGTVALTKGFGPFSYTKFQNTIPACLSTLLAHILTNVMPQLPAALHTPIQKALDKDRLRRMPNSFLPPIEQGAGSAKQGVILLGDAWNMRHPLTGGGMTVALHDVMLLRGLLGKIEHLRDWAQVKAALHEWHWSRKPLASTINILSVALYDLFGADGEALAVLRMGCFKYFERGGECINGPVSLLSGVAPSPVLLANHFFAVAFYSIWVMFTHPQRLPDSGPKPVYAVPRVEQYPGLFLKSFRVFWTACIVFGPLLWSEIRWWSPEDRARKNSVFAKGGVPLLSVLLLGTWLWRMS